MTREELIASMLSGDAGDDLESSHRLAVLLAVVLDVVHHGGSITITGSGMLSAPGQPRYATRMQSHTGARYASGAGATLGECLEQAVTAWSKL